VTLTREDLAARLAELKRSDVPRASLERLNRRLEHEAGGAAGAITAALDTIQVDRYLRRFAWLVRERDGELVVVCPGCETRGLFSWGNLHGSGSCACGWPGTLLHYVLDERPDPDLVCCATVNGERVCRARRGEHVEKVAVSYGVSSGERFERLELRCPGLLDEPFGRTFRAPEIARFNRILWAHPYELRMR
jgi:hypothetical protein